MKKYTKCVNKKYPTKIEQEKYIIKCFKISKIIFYFIIAIINIFSWYYASCFCAVYQKTQYQLFFDILLERLMNFINCILACLINLIIKCIVIKGNYSKIKKYLLKIFNIEIVSFIIEKLIEFCIIKLIIKK